MSSSSYPASSSAPSHPFLNVMTSKAVQTATDFLKRDWSTYLQDEAYFDQLKTRLQNCIRAIPALCVSGVATYACHRYMGSYHISIPTALLSFATPFSLFGNRSEAFITRQFGDPESSRARLQKCLRAISALFVAGATASIAYYHTSSSQLPACAAIASFATVYFLAPTTLFQTLANKMSRAPSEAYANAIKWNTPMTTTITVLQEAFRCKALSIFDAVHEELAKPDRQSSEATTLINHWAQCYDNNALGPEHISAPPYAQKTKPPAEYHAIHFNLQKAAQMFLNASKIAKLQGKSFATAREIQDLARRLLHGSSAATPPASYIKPSPQDGGGFKPDLWEPDAALTGYWEMHGPKRVTT